MAWTWALAICWRSCSRSRISTDYAGWTGWFAVRHWCSFPDGQPRSACCRLACAGWPGLGIIYPRRPSSGRCTADCRRQKRVQVYFTSPTEVLHAPFIHAAVVHAPLRRASQMPTPLCITSQPRHPSASHSRAELTGRFARQVASGAAGTTAARAGGNNGEARGSALHDSSKWK
jgi:hypothetical protein